MSEFALLQEAAAAGPVSWQVWSPALLSQAHADQRPIVVLLGDGLDYYATAWLANLHADADVAELLSSVCLPAIADPRAFPGLAHRVQQVLALTAGAEGWPALAVVLPDGRPLGAVPYAPVRDAERRVGVARILVDLLSAWAEAPSDLAHDAGIIASTCCEMDGPAGGERMPKASLVVPAVEAAVLAQADELEGGFGPPPRRVAPVAIDFLIDRWAAGDAAPAVVAAVERHLQAVLAGACFDHLGGGVFAATTTRDWSQPLFERRTWDNARFLEQLARVAALSDQSLYRHAGMATAAWLASRRRADGLLDAGLAAASRGASGRLIPGAAWVWSPAAVADVVGREAGDIFSARFLADERSAVGDDWFVPCQRGAVRDAERLPAICRRLAVARSERPQPAAESTAWLADQAAALLALAAWAQHDSHALEIGLALGEAVLARWSGDPQGWPTALASDHAPLGHADPGALGLLAQALLAWSEQRPQWTAVAETVLATALQACDAAGRVCLPVDGLALPAPIGGADKPDGPAPAAVLAAACRCLAKAGGSTVLSSRESAILRAHAPLLTAAPQAAAGLARVLVS